MNFLCLTVALLAQVPPPSMGPTPPSLKGLRRPIPITAGISDLARTILKDLGGGAVVVVEGELPLPLPKITSGLQVLGGRLRLFGPAVRQPYDLPVFPWMDTNTVRSGPNVVGRTYPMGWGY